MFTPLLAESSLFSLLAVKVLLSLLTCGATAWLFAKPIGKILARLLSEELAPIWQRYMLFAFFVVGLTGGVQVWDIERFITPDRDGNKLAITPERWTVELYKTVIGSLQGIAFMLLAFFGVTLVGYVLLRAFELWRGHGDKSGEKQ